MLILKSTGAAARKIRTAEGRSSTRAIPAAGATQRRTRCPHRWGTAAATPRAALPRFGHVFVTPRQRRGRGYHTDRHQGWSFLTAQAIDPRPEIADRHTTLVGELLMGQAASRKLRNEA